MEYLKRDLVLGDIKAPAASVTERMLVPATPNRSLNTSSEKPDEEISMIGMGIIGFSLLFLIVLFVALSR